MAEVVVPADVVRRLFSAHFSMAAISRPGPPVTLADVLDYGGVLFWSETYVQALRISPDRASGVRQDDPLPSFVCPCCQTRQRLTLDCVGNRFRCECGALFVHRMPKQERRTVGRDFDLAVLEAIANPPRSRRIVED